MRTPSLRVVMRRVTVARMGGLRNAIASVVLSVGVLSCRSATPHAVTSEPTLPRPPVTTPVSIEPAKPVAPSALALLRQAADSMVDDPQFRNAHWGILIVDPVKGDTLYAHNADKLFMPASNQKIVTASVGLTLLGANYTWRTPVLLRGAQKGATFTGDVVLNGRGDPSWSDALHNGDALAALTPIADALAARGITRLIGQVGSEGDAFSDATTGFGWAYDDFDFGYSAPIDELLFNEGFFMLHVNAGDKVGKPVRVATRPTTAYPKVVVLAVARDRADSVGPMRRIRAEWDSVAQAVIVTGSLPAGDSTHIELSYRHPADATVAAVMQVLDAAHIRVTAPAMRSGAAGRARGGKESTRARASTGKPGAPESARGLVGGARTVDVRALDTLVVLQSPPLSDVLRRLEKPSQNQLAEMLYKTIALERTGMGRADSARAVIQRQLTAWGVPPEAIAVRDGSGLSRHDYVAPRTLVRILDAMRQSPSFDAFYSALPIAGVDGTIANRMKGTVAEGKVHAKTGTVDKARSLSGYVTTADGQMLIFSMLCNNYTVPTRAVERVQDALAVRLAGMQLRDVVSGREK